jgi:hypothetical protein
MERSNMMVAPGSLDPTNTAPFRLNHNSLVSRPARSWLQDRRADNFSCARAFLGERPWVVATRGLFQASRRLFSGRLRGRRCNPKLPPGRD